MIYAIVAGMIAVLLGGGFWLAKRQGRLEERADTQTEILDDVRQADEIRDNVRRSDPRALRERLRKWQRP